jgi:hypothetical protein
VIRARFVGGPKRYQGIHRLARTPELLILTMGNEHHIYQRAIDPDTGDFIDVYEFHSTRYSTDEAMGLES